MSVFRVKGSKFYQFDFQIAGHRFSGSTKCVDECEAASFEEERKQEARELLERAAVTGTAPLTIRTAADRWWSEHGQYLNDPDIAARLDWLCAQIGPQTALHAITDDTVSRLVQARRRDVRRSGRDADGRQLYRPITARTVNKTTVSLLRRVLRRARDNWDATILREPSWKKHWLKETRRPVRELSQAEDAALDAVECADYAALRRFAIITGLRRGNLLLTWSQVDFEQAVVRVITKGGVPRVLPLTREAYDILWSRRGQHAEFVFTFVAQRTRPCTKRKDARGKPFKFIRGQRYPITYYGLGSNKRKWARAGVNARIHDLRHTTGMRTLRTTGNLRVVQGILGHRDIAITAKFYTDALVDDMREAMERTSGPPPAPTIAAKKI